MTARTFRIALVSEHASPLAVIGGEDAGGQNVHVAELARHLARLGAQVTVHTRRDDPSLPPTVAFAPGVVVHHVDAGPAAPLPKDDLLPWMPAFTDELVRSWADTRPDVVHAHFWMSGLAARDAARRVGLPVALTFHALGAVKRHHQGTADTSPAVREAIERELARTVDLVLATSHDELRQLATLDATPAASVVVPCGVDGEAFRPHRGRGRSEAHPEVPPRPPGRHRVVTVGRLVARKGIGDIVEAVASLDGTELLVAGGPPAGLLDGDPHAAALLAVAEARGIAERVHLLGAVPRAAMPSLLRSADAVCLYPWYEPFGIVAVEAMACGVPVVAAATGGLAETVLDGVTGRLVPPRHPAALAATIEELLHDRGARRAMGRAGHRRAERYGWPRIASETFGALSRLADRRPADGGPAGRWEGLVADGAIAGVAAEIADGVRP